MNKKLVRALMAALLILASGSTGYLIKEGGTQAESIPIPAQTVPALAPGSTRIVYSLDKRQSDTELIALIDDAKEYVYFAIYTFTLPSIADALVRAKERGIDVRGVMDSEQSKTSYGAPITAKLLDAGIPLLVERHAGGNGIMHIKLLVTERAYVFGSYNWTKSATTINDEIIEIGTDAALRQAYENILLKLFSAYKGSNAAASAAAPVSIGIIDYDEAPAHIGEYASVRGTLVKAHTSKSGTVFLDFCKDYKTCPFSGVIFADDVKAFGDLSRYTGTEVTLSGKIVSYEGRSEIILSSPSQLSH